MSASTRPTRQPKEDLRDYINRVVEWKKNQAVNEQLKDVLLATKIRLKGKDHRALKSSTPTTFMNPLKNWSKRSTLILIGIIAFFVITNPSLRALKEHEGYDTYTGISRSYNFLIFSIYDDSGTKYLGICENFIKL